MKKKTVFLMAMILIFTCLCSSTSAETTKPREFILVTEYQQMGWGEKFQLGAIDSNGNLWCYQDNTRGNIPYDNHIMLSWAESTDKLELDSTLTESELADIKSLVQTVQAQKVSYQSSACDAGTQTSFAVRKDKNGESEIIILGVSGDDTYENTDPSAQSLYASLRSAFPWVIAYEGEKNMSPAGFEKTDILSFCGYEGIDLSQLKMTAYYNDCEAGASETEPRLSVEEIAGMSVIGKKNSMFTTGNTVTYCFEDNKGKTIAAFEFYRDLLVWQDGMYALAK